MPTPAKSHGCTWHRITAGDLPEIAGLIEAEEYLGDAIHHHDLPELTRTLATAGGAGEEGVVLRKPSGTLIAYAWNQVPAAGRDGRVYLHGGCHPAWRHEGVQETLLDWQVERALEWYLEQDGDREPLELVLIGSATNHVAAELLPTKGFPAQKWYHALRRPLADPLDAHLPDVRFEPFGPQWSEPVRALYNGSVVRTSDALDADAWQWGLTAAGIRDDMSFVALAGDAPVGWVLNTEMELAGERTGWTEYLGATVPWRNRGLYPALLARSHAAFRTLGLTTAGIGVETDSDQGARPYLQLGYQPVDTMVWYVNHPSLDTLGAANEQAADGA